MSIALDPCFQYIFGLSRTECDCDQYLDGQPTDFDVSDSGIYLDELAGLTLKMIESASDCEKGSLWNMMDAARAEAVQIFRSDLLSCIVANARIRREPFAGIIGDYTKGSKVLNMGSATYAGFRIRVADIVGGVAVLRRIGLKFNTTGTKTITIYDTTGEVVAVLSNLATEANKIKWSTLSEPLTLPINADTRNYTDYNFIYTMDANKPLDMKLSCNCGSGFKPYWNADQPVYIGSQDKGNYKWANFAMAGGVKGNDLTIIDEWIANTFTHGIALDMQFGCDASKTICNEELDYTNDPYAKVMAYTMRFKAAEILLKKILASPDPSYYTLAAPEILSSFITEYKMEYDQRVFEFLCKEISDPANINRYSDCYTCRDHNAFMMSGIFK